MNVPTGWAEDLKRIRPRSRVLFLFGWMNSVAAFHDWQNQVSSFSQDTVSGGTCFGTTVVCQSGAGNWFLAGSDPSLSLTTPTNPVVTGDALELERTDTGPGSFTWVLAQPANAFGFFAGDNDAGTITITFAEGIEQIISFGPPNGAGAVGDSVFWGVTGLAGNALAVNISTTDPGGISYWDNFVSGVTVPVPAALPLFLSALALFGMIARRRQTGPFRRR